MKKIVFALMIIIGFASCQKTELIEPCSCGQFGSVEYSDSIVNGTYIDFSRVTIVSDCTGNELVLNTEPITIQVYNEHVYLDESENIYICVSDLDLIPEMNDITQEELEDYAF